MKDTTMTLRIPEATAKRLVRATDKAKDPYAPTKTSILLRGLQLALKEMEAK